MRYRARRTKPIRTSALEKNSRSSPMRAPHKRRNCPVKSARRGLPPLTRCVGADVGRRCAARRGRFALAERRGTAEFRCRRAPARVGTHLVPCDARDAWLPAGLCARRPSSTKVSVEVAARPRGAAAAVGARRAHVLAQVKHDNMAARGAKGVFRGVGGAAVEGRLSCPLACRAARSRCGTSVRLLRHGVMIAACRCGLSRARAVTRGRVRVRTGLPSPST